MRAKLRNFYIALRAKVNYTKDALFGDREFKKFFIISDSRTGSTLVNNMLNFHPNIVAEGEVFKMPESQSSVQAWHKLFRKRPKKIDYVGCKLFYHHPLLGDREVWDLVENDKSIIIIHLIRKNILRSLVSKKIGLKTKKWTENIHSHGSIDLEKKKIELEVEECETYFNEIINHQERIDKIFSNHKLIHVTYEELAKDRRKIINKIFKEFDLEIYDRDSELKKQNPESLQDLILNFEELQNQFNGTKWESYFYEEK